MTRAIPATLGFIACGVIGFGLIYFDDPGSLVHFLTFTDFSISGGKLRFLPTEGQYWRLLTPIFLHFGWLHIVFNSLWMWELGGLLERRLGSISLLALVVLSGIVSNTAQYLWTGPSLFGGLSGVVYALLGFCWIYNWLLPHRRLAVPQGIIVFMLVWLVLCMVVPTGWLGFGIANAAHLGGLVFGCLAALPVAASQRSSAGDRSDGGMS